MKPRDYFAAHPVFRYDEFVAAHSGGGRRSIQTSQAALKQHVAAGNLVHIRRGLYAVVPRAAEPETATVDPYLIATKLREDAVVAYHAALQLHGKAYSLWSRYHYLTRGRTRSFSFRDVEFVPVRPPVAIRSLPDMGSGVIERPRAGGKVRVTTLERTLVDVLDKPATGGGWEEIWRSLGMVEFFDLDAVLEHALKLESALTVARVGFFLEQRRDDLMVEDRYLDALRERAPSQARYLDASRQPGKLIPRWNLIMPEAVLERSWQEPM